MSHRLKIVLIAAVFVPGAILSSCVLYQPTGNNKAEGVYPTPNGSKITIPYTASSSDVTKVTFAIADQPDVTIPESDTADSGFQAVVDVSKLQPGVYTIDVTENDADTATGHLTLLVPSGVTPDSGSSSTPTSTPAASDAGASS